MKIPYQAVAMGILALAAGGCGDWASLTIPPRAILTDDRVWGDPTSVTGVLANYYNRLPFHQTLTANGNFATIDEAMWSGADNNEQEAANALNTYAYNRWTLWGGNNNPYILIRDINLAIDGITATTSGGMTPALKAGFIAELRFLRAYEYFEMVKRMGGIPLVTGQMPYDFSGDPSSLQLPRNTEADVYNFIIAEMDAIKNDLGNAGSQTRANKATTLALKSRAALYAGSLARHNSEMANPITLPGGVVGIPASMAAGYYQKSLDASKELIALGTNQLYRLNPNLGENFYEAVTKKSGNTEVIFVTDYLASQGRSHAFTRSTIPYGLRRDVQGTTGGSAIAVTTQLVESFDRLNGQPGAFAGVGTGSNTAAGQNWVFYDKVGDIFNDRDARLYGTVLLPGSSFAGEALELQAGVYEWSASLGRYERRAGPRNSTFTDGLPLTGRDGPIPVDAYVPATGFLLRKYLDTAPGARSSAIDSDMWWVRFRMGEVYMNAAEAAFELGLMSEALGYINTLRERAGFPANSLTVLTRSKIRSERWNELAFEDHRLFDLMRWRIAHELWDGTPASLTANAYSLYGYRIVRPGHPDHGKWVYDRIKTQRQTQPRNFRMGNYYSEIPAAVLNANPKLIRNPFH